MPGWSGRRVARNQDPCVEQCRQRRRKRLRPPRPGRPRASPPEIRNRRCGYEGTVPSCTYRDGFLMDMGPCRSESRHRRDDIGPATVRRSGSMILDVLVTHGSRRLTSVPGYDGRHLRDPLCPCAGHPARSSISEDPDELQTRELEEIGKNSLLNPIPAGDGRRPDGGRSDAGRQADRTVRRGTGPARTPQPHGLVRIWDCYIK